jgi:RNA polymerase sigma-70 factor, ECF subfamily
MERMATDDPPFDSRVTDGSLRTDDLRPPAVSGQRPAASGRVLELFREHGPAIYRFAAALMRQPADADDVVQETFLKLLHHLRGGGDMRNPRGWLFTVAAHACRDRQRRRLRWLPWTTDREPAVDPPPLADEDGRLATARHALARLGARDRLLITLRAQGLSYREIAEASAVRASSVGQLLARALDRWERGCRHAAPAPSGDHGHELPERRAHSSHRR